MHVVFLQTCDSGRYLELLQASSRTIRAYCDTSGCAYEAFVGIRRGYFPWHASFNRIYLLEEQLDRGRYDWAVYMDVDAYIADLGFDVKRYLARKRRYAAVTVPSGATRERWDVNDGVLMLNLRHPYARRLVAAWRAAYEAIPDETLRKQETWSNPDDQEMLQFFLRDDPDASRFVHNAPRKLINSVHARFIQQVVRAFFPDFMTRLRTLEARVERVLETDGAPGSHVPRADAEAFVDKMYRAVLRRSADGAGLAHFTPLVEHLGLEAGAQVMLDEMLESDEHRSAALKPR